ncbi:MAG: DUF4190 domain-containing protein [Bacilli bacterium]|nr:DUF4190 domain-containing protein [Bacilli bacterium]
MEKYCGKCGKELSKTDVFCPNCGEKVPSAIKKMDQQTTTSNKSSSKKTNGMAIAGFVISLVSAVLCCGAFNVIGLIFSIVGLAQAKKYDGNGKGFAIAGIVISGIIVLLYLLVGTFRITVPTIEIPNFDFPDIEIPSEFTF